MIHVITVAVTGGIASGKSEVLKVAETFSEVRTVQADLLAKEVYDPENPCFPEVVDLFGSDIVTEDGSVDLQMVSTEVFSDPGLLEDLEEISHPYVKGRIEGMVECFRKQGIRLTLIEVPLLFQSPHVDLDTFDLVVLVDASRDDQIERLVSREGVSEEEARRRMELQGMPDEAADKSDYVISSKGSVEETRSQARKFINDLLD